MKGHRTPPEGLSEENPRKMGTSQWEIRSGKDRPNNQAHESTWILNTDKHTREKEVLLYKRMVVVTKSPFCNYSNNSSRQQSTNRLSDCLLRNAGSQTTRTVPKHRGKQHFTAEKPTGPGFTPAARGRRRSVPRGSTQTRAECHFCNVPDTNG